MHFQKIVNSFHKDYPEKTIVTLTTLDSASLMAKSTIHLPAKRKWRWPKERVIKCTKWGDKEESESVWFSIKPEAGRRLKIYLPSARNVGKPIVPVWLFAVRPHWELNSTLFWPSPSSTKSLLNQVPPWPSPSLTKFLFSLHIFSFFFLSLV